MRWQVGDVRITQVVELTTASLGPYLLPQATPEEMDRLPWIKPFVDDRRRLVLSIHALVVESGGETLVVDTCIGNGKARTYPAWNRMQRSFLEDFAAAGFAVDGVDKVMCTHMHVDHVGWNTRLVDDRWVPTFENADYLFAEEEWQHWRVEEQEYGPVIEDSVQPIFDAGKAVLVAQDHRVNDEIWLEPTPGHTPGHVSVHIASRGEEAIITGDMIHHPCQIAHPHWSSVADADPNLSAATRHDFMQRYADRPVLVIGTHFAAPTAGRIVRDGEAFRLDC
ncbi:MAG: MBL fold metallo-hydrolase [Gammaproteobacteria bacterium]|nr:MBL fold metallo-hydrolase [Gammaproteobacteria bacterium]